MTRVTRGDPVAIDDLLARELPALRAFVRLRAGPRVRRHESASDLVQSVCRELLEELDDFSWRGEAAFRHWLFTAALRKILDRDRFWRQERRDVDREAAPAADTTRDVLAAYGHALTPSRRAVAREDLEALEQAFDGLSDDQRRVLSLIHLVGLTYEEVAVAMDRTEAWCRNQASRGLARLSFLLDP